MALLIAIVLAVSVLCVGCRSGPDVTVDPIPMMRIAGSAAVDAAILSGEITREQLVVIQPYVCAARDVCKAAPADRPAVLSEVLLAQVPADSPDVAALTYYLTQFLSAVEVKMKPDNLARIEQANALSAAFLDGCAAAISRVVAVSPPPV